MTSLQQSNFKSRIEEQQRIAKANQALVRFLQLSLQLFFQWGFYSFSFLQPASRFMIYQKPSHFLSLRSHQQPPGEPDDDYYTTIVQPLCLLWTLYNILIYFGIKCLDQMSKISFIITAAINYLVAIFITVIGFIQGATEDPAGKQIYHRYAPFQILNALIVVSLFYFTKFPEPRRFSTSPGNFVWVWLFVAWEWADDIQAYMLSIGIIYAIITLTSVYVLFLEISKGMTTTIRKLILAQWIFSLILTGLTQIFAIVSHNIIQQIADRQIQDDIAVSVLQIFIIVNILDMLFWTIGRCFM